jgi:opacity protein-like surface antigen
VGGLRIGLLAGALVLGSFAPAAAQFPFTGLVTAYIGAAQKGDVGAAAATGGASLAVLDLNGMGAEVDVAYTGAFDRAFFASASVTSVALNFVAAYPEGALRPFVNAGVGLLRLRTGAVEGQPIEARTSAAWNAGAGAFLHLTEWVAVRGDLRYFRLLWRPDGLVLRNDGYFDYWRTSVGATFTWPIR